MKLAMASVIGLATVVALLQLATASFLDIHGRRRLRHPWVMLPDWFDRPLQPFNTDLLDSDPFHDSFFDWDWNDELLFPSTHPFLTDNTPKPTQLANKLKFNLEVQGFRPEDLTLKLQGRDLVIQGEKSTCGYSSCYKRRYSAKRRLPEDVDLDTIKARLSARGELQIEANRKGVEGKTFSELPQRSHQEREFQDGCRGSQRNDERTAKGWRYSDMRKPARTFHDTVQSMWKNQRTSNDDSHRAFQGNSKQGHDSTRYVKENEERGKSRNVKVVESDEEATIEVLPE